jgi:hypothetical protein
MTANCGSISSNSDVGSQGLCFCNDLARWPERTLEHARYLVLDLSVLGVRSAHTRPDVRLNVLKVGERAQFDLLLVLQRDDHITPQTNATSDGDHIDDLIHRHISALGAKRRGGQDGNTL